MASKRRGNGDSSIYQRQSDGRWVAAITLSNGRRKSLYGKTRADVKAKLAEAQRKLDDGISLDADKLTVATFLDRWLESSVKPSVKHKTYTGYESLVRTRVVPYIGTTLLSKLTPLDLQSLYATITSDGLSPRSAHHVHRCLHRALGRAVRWNLISRNPCDGAQAPKAPRAEMKVWTLEQIDSFLIATREHRMHALYVVALTTGMRQGELLGLKWGDIDLNASTLAVRRSLQAQKGKGLVFETPKTSRSRRAIHLSKRAIDAMKHHRDTQMFERKTAGSEWRDGDLVFCTAMGAPLSPTNETKRFQRAATAAGLPAIRFHDLRHSCASMLLSKGVHVKLVSEMLGHSTITLTLDTYAHILPTMHGDAAAAIDAILTA